MQSLLVKKLNIYVFEYSPTVKFIGELFFAEDLMRTLITPRHGDYDLG